MAQMKTPGVYIVEKNAFPSSIVEVATAVPAFIGFTEKADNDGKSLLNKPWRITSMTEFHTYFGSAPKATFAVTNLTAANPESLSTDFTYESKSFPKSFPKSDFHLKQDAAGQYLLYYSMLLFYANGGGACYIVSVGLFPTTITSALLSSGIELLKKEQEPTLVVIPEAVLLTNEIGRAHV